MIRPPIGTAATSPVRRSRCRTFLFVAATVAAALFASCATAEAAGNAESDATPADGTEPRYVQPRETPQVRDTFTMVITDGRLELNPLRSYTADEAQLFTGLYEGLFTYDPLTLEPIPAVAARYEISEDKKTWTFHLREDARYWNGGTVLASHFRDAWLRMIDPAEDNPYASLFDLIAGAKEYRQGKNKDPESVGIAAPDAHTLVVSLAAPAAYFTRVLCHHSFSPIHPEMLAKKDWSDGPIIGNGPYYLYRREADRLVLKRNELYWDAARVSIPTIVVRFQEDGKSAAGLWNSGEAQWIAGSVDIDALNSDRGISIHPMFATHYYYIRCPAPPLSDRRVRRALALALPWDQIREGYLLPAKTLIYPIPDYPAVQGIEKQDSEEAARLLAEAGHGGGAGIPPLVIRIPPSEDARRIAGLMAEAWKGLGVSSKIDEVPYADYFDSLKRDDYAVGSTTWIGDFADPYTFLQMWRSDSNLNDAGFSDEEYEQLIDRSLTEEGEKRYATLADAEKLLLDTGTVLPISYTPALNVIDTDEIDGWYPNGLDIHPLKYLTFAAFRPLPGVAVAPAR